MADIKKILNIAAWIWLILAIINVLVLGIMFCSIATCFRYSCEYNFLSRCCGCENPLGFIFGIITWGAPSWILLLIARKMKNENNKKRVKK